MKQIKNMQEYDEFLAVSPVSLVEFKTQWCPVCRGMEPVLEAVEKNAAGRAEVAYVDAGEQSMLDIARKADVMAVPSFIIFKAGKELFRHTGALTEARLAEELGKAAL